jgi:hypothetical protein
MACLSITETAINVAKGTASSAKSSYDSALSSLRGINPENFTNRADFEAAKSAAIATGKGALDTYISGIDGVNSAAAALSIISGSDLDALAITNGAAMSGILALIPDGPGSLAAIDAAVLAQQSLQC